VRNAETAAAQRAPEDGEHGAVVHQAVHQQDGDVRGQRVGGEQGARGGRLDARAHPRVGPQRLGPGAQRVHERVGADPGQLGEPARL